MIMTNIKANQVILILLLIFISAIFFAMIRYFILAIFLAALFASLLMPIFIRIERWCRGRKNISAVLTMATMLLIVVLPLVMLLGVVAKQAIRISNIAMPWVQQQILESASVDQQLRSLPFYADIELYRDDILQKAGELAGKTGAMLFNSISSLTYSAVNDLFLLFIFLYTIFFFLRDGRELLEKVLSLLPLTYTDQNRLLDKFLSVTRATIKGTLVVGIVQGSLAGFALHVAGIDSVLFWATVMILLSVIPMLGTALVWIPAVLYLVAVGHYPQAIGLFLFCSIVVGQIDNIIRPILIGRDTQMHELLIFFGTLGGIGMFGIFGFIVGPIVAALFLTIWEMYGESFKEYLTHLKSDIPSRNG